MFIKDEALGIDGHYDKLPEWMLKRTFIICHPRRVALLMCRLLSHPVEYEGNIEDFEIELGHPFMAWEKLSPDPMYKLWNYVRDNIDPNPIVFDADDLQKDPEQMLRKYCEAVGIPYKEKFLKWEKSDESLKYFNGALDQLVWGRNVGIYDAAFLPSCFFPLQGLIPDTIPDNCTATRKSFETGTRPCMKQD
ncbi:hypothetical protein HOLleu_14620 [Holothuria leucospilota]|uniref:Uncharacterized protein n=1 Tax=Holothuria leucospilota TaxID=206669 RepID=A0A9Q1C981_HOLLE|nr:hypothetical protein HOLleu_14620 [Holothuria leucospilota]